MVPRNKYNEDLGKVKYRLDKFVLNMQHVTRKDMNRMKANKVYERRMNHHLFGPKGLNCQYKQELERLKSDQHDAQRELIRINRNSMKTTSLSRLSPSSPVVQTKEPIRNNKPRLSSIIEENSSAYFIEKSKSFFECSSPMCQNQTTRDHLMPIQKTLSLNKIHSKQKHNHWLCKYSFQRDIAKTTDDHMYLQQRVHLINQQKRLFEQKLKKFLN